MLPVAVSIGVALIALTLYVLVRGRDRLGSPALRVDPFAVGEPWRQHMAAAQSAQRRFTKIVLTFDDGPLRASMAKIGREVDLAVAECWEIAKRGDQLDATIRDLGATALQTRFDRATDDGQRASLQSQLDSVGRIRSAREQTDARLRSLHTRLGELVSQAAEVQTGVDHTSELGDAVDDVVAQLQALSAAVDEVNTTGRSRGFEDVDPGTASPPS